MVKFDLNKFLEDKNAMIRLAVFFVLLVLYIAPGVLLVAYARPELLVELSELKLFFLSAAVSLPLHVLAALLLVAPASTQFEIMQDPSALRRYVLSVAALVWAILLLLLLPVIAALMAWLFPAFGELSTHYQLLYAYFLFFTYCLVVFARGFAMNLKGNGPG